MPKNPNPGWKISTMMRIMPRIRQIAGTHPMSEKTSATSSQNVISTSDLRAPLRAVRRLCGLYIIYQNLYFLSREVYFAPTAALCTPPSSLNDPRLCVRFTLFLPRTRFSRLFRKVSVPDRSLRMPNALYIEHLFAKPPFDNGAAALQRVAAMPRRYGRSVRRQARRSLAFPPSAPPLSSPFVKYSTRYVFCQYTNRVFLAIMFL